MDARFYNSDDIDIERLASDLVNAYVMQGYQAQQVGNKDQMMVQIKKGGDFEALIGMQAALSLTLQKTSGGVLAMIGQQKWIDKAAVGAIGIVAAPILWPLALTAGVGAIRQASLGNQILNMTDGLVRQQKPGIQAGPVPYNLTSQVQQQWAPPQSKAPYYTPPNAQPTTRDEGVPTYTPPQPGPTIASVPGQLRCTHCNTPYEKGDTFCSGCGRSLAPAKLYCSNCNFELKPGVAFCPKCGATTFQDQAKQSAGRAPQAPTVAPTPTISYVAPTPLTPPAPATPVYTPTPAPAPAPKPEVPYYTPPPNIYTPPAASAPTVAAQAAVSPTPPKPEVPVYTPPKTQDPQYVPQPTVTYSQSAQKQDATPPAPAPKKDEIVYYVPSAQAQQAPAAPAPKPVQPAQPKQATPGEQDKQDIPYYTPPAQSPQPPASPAAQQAKPRVQQPAHVPAPPKPPLKARPLSESAADTNAPWGQLTFTNGQVVQLTGELAAVGRADHDLGGDVQPQVDLSKMDGADTVSRIHALIEHVGSTFTLTDLNSTNATRLNGKRLEPDKATPFNDGDTLVFGKVTSTFKKL